MYAITGGNPFFVSEVLRATGDDVPETVRAAVLARASRLSPAARAVLDLAAVSPGRIELWLIEAIYGRTTPAIEECVSTGLLRLGDESLSFRHELVGLTSRQLKAFLLMAEGFSNSEIAVKLTTSPKTLEHHISSILAKWHARFRAQAIAATHNLGAIPNPH